MVQFLSIIFFSLISSVFVGFFKCFRFFVNAECDSVAFCRVCNTHRVTQKNENF